MNELLINSAYFGFVITLGAYLAGLWLKKKTGLAVMNPLLVGVILVIGFLLAAKVEYQTYMEGAKYISYLLTPSTVCLAIPLYKQLQLLKDNAVAVMGGITSGVITSAVCIFVLAKLLKLDHQLYVTFLPKSITTAIGMGVCEEAGGITVIAVVCIILTGILGNIIAESLFKLIHIHHPIARGLALGTSAHAIGTARALEMGEVEGAMSSLAIAVAGLMTVIVAPLAAGLI